MNEVVNMRKSFKSCVCAGLVLILTGCASLHSVSLTQVPKVRQAEVSAKVHSWNFLGIAFDNDFADEARRRLRDQCPGGDIQGIMTTYETYNYVLMIKREVRARGFCVKG